MENIIMVFVFLVVWPLSGLISYGIWHLVPKEINGEQYRAVTKDPDRLDLKSLMLLGGFSLLTSVIWLFLYPIFKKYYPVKN